MISLLCESLSQKIISTTTLQSPPKRIVPWFLFCFKIKICQFMLCVPIGNELARAYHSIRSFQIGYNAFCHSYFLSIWEIQIRIWIKSWISSILRQVFCGLILRCDCKQRRHLCSEGTILKFFIQDFNHYSVLFHWN